MGGRITSFGIKVIIDLADEDVLLPQTDICIIGSGIAAYTLLKSLLPTHKVICLIERGNIESLTADAADKECIIEGHDFTGHTEGRHFGAGGTSVLWGGQSLPLDKDDFQEKSWIPFSGWPIQSSDLTQYILKAEQLLNVDGASYQEHDANALMKSESMWNANKCRLHYSKWSPTPNFQHALLDLVSDASNIHLVINARATKLNPDPTHHSIENISVRSTTTKSFTLKSKLFVLAAGGLENPRLLLASPDLPVLPMTGKMFQDHPAAQVATVIPKKEKLLHSMFNYFFLDHTRCLPRISMASAYRQEHQLLNATSFLQFISQTESPVDVVRTLYRKLSRRKSPSVKEWLGLSKLVKNPIATFNLVHTYINQKHIYNPRSTPRLTVMAEQEPDIENYVALSAERDHEDQQKLIIHWQISDKTVNTIKEMSTIVSEEIHRLNLGTVRMDTWMSSDNETIKRHLTDAYHHMGTTRMSVSPDHGVVDGQCRVHGVHNLFIAGTSVFPTSGHSNPTLTMMALSIRLADHIKLSASA